MTSLELFSACLILAGLAAAGAYTYALNRGSSRLRDTDADGLSEASAQEALHRQQEGERELGEAVGRADLAASSAEAAADRAEAALQALEASRVRQAASVAYAFTAADMADKPYAGLNLKQYMVAHPFGGIGSVVGQGGSFTLELISGRVIKVGAKEQPSEQSDASTSNYASIQ